LLAQFFWHSGMDTLFPVESFLPQGFLYVQDFLKEEDEKHLLDVIRGIELHPMIFQGFEAKRKVASFGFDYSFEKRNLSKGKEIPSAFDAVIKKVANQMCLPSSAFAELLVTEYPAGSVINWHRDAPPFDRIAGISLQSDCIFKLRPHDKAKQGRSSIISLPVKRRSLYIMEGSSRSEWQHSIAPVKEVRYSITLRTLRN
jgi:alkylated DNA repair dioxygenase AlkB